MRRVLTNWVWERPAAKAVALFSGLNLSMVTVFALALAFTTASRTPAPYATFFLSAALTVGVALALYCFMLISLRPGKRRPLELGLLVFLGVVTVALTTLYLRLPILSLALIPLVARYWLSLKQTLFVAAGLIVWSAGWYAFLAPQSFGETLVVALFFGSLALLFGGYTLLSLEFAVREAKAREELDRSYQQLSRYRDLEVKHAHLAERTRISRELHDTLGHHLTAQHFDLHIMKRLGAEPHSLAETLNRATERNQEALEDLRRAVNALRPDRLEHLKLSAALEQLINLAASSDTVRLCVTGEEAVLAEDLSLTVYRLAQESLTNRAKHAPEQPLEMRLAFECEEIVFEACNPLGSRAEPAPASSGVGLVGLEERIKSLGGQFHVSVSNNHFRLWATLPR